MTARIEADPTDAEAWFLRGAAHRGLSQLAAARADLEQAIRLAPDNVRARDLLAAVLWSLNA